jgi:O-antigen/teichoic acid export membrane protein
MNSPSYNDSIPVFYILAIGILAPATFNFTGAYFAMADLLNLSFILIIARFIFNIIVCYIFISLFGYYGAAMATSLTYLFSFSLSFLYLKKKMGINILKFKM